MTVSTALYLGPAQVQDVLGDRVSLRLRDQETWATMAMVNQYRPLAGDVVLAIGDGEEFYVIGVITGRGQTVMTVPGDLKIIAPKGSIDLVAMRGVSITSPAIRMQTNRLEVMARSCFERFDYAYSWVREKLHVRAGRMKTSVKDNYHLSAERIVENARRDVTIDGDSVNLG
jgi:hypothetical protein